MKKAFCIALLAVAASQAPAADSRSASLAGGLPAASSRSAFLTKCSRCHEPERAYAVIGDWPEWVMTVARMAIMDREWIPPETLKLIISYSSHYRDHQIALFRERCAGCHRWEGLLQLGKSASQWRTWARFMSQRHGAELTREECELLVSGLTIGDTEIPEEAPLPRFSGTAAVGPRALQGPPSREARP